MPTLIQQYASSVIAGFLSRIEALRQLEHRPTKGELRELFVAEVLRSLLTPQFDVASGIIVNQAGTQSRQTDIVIYDNRLLPPFIREQRICVFPAECVVATVEVKSRLTTADVHAAQSAALVLKNDVYDPDQSIYPQFYPYMRPICGVVGFYGTGLGDLNSLGTGEAWLDENATALESLCLTGKWSWLRVQDAWVGQMDDGTGAFEETKRFVAVLLDNVRTNAEKRLQAMTQQPHLDLLGAYLRNQGLFEAPDV